MGEAGGVGGEAGGGAGGGPRVLRVVGGAGFRAARACFGMVVEMREVLIARGLLAIGGRSGLGRRSKYASRYLSR